MFSCFFLFLHETDQMHTVNVHIDVWPFMFHCRFLLVYFCYRAYLFKCIGCYILYCLLSIVYRPTLLPLT